jgi:hypothetical protein
MRTQIVANEMNVEIGRDLAVDGHEKLSELVRAMPWVTPPN